MHQSSTLNIMQFDSIPELGAYCKDNKISHMSGAPKWTAHLSANEAAELCITGDASHVAAAEKLMEQFSEQLSSICLMDQPSVAGCYPCVPEALAGEPECMREPQEMESETAPLTILVDVSSSSYVSTMEMRKRGIAILALVMALSATRPVSLYLTNIQEGPKRAAANGDLFSIITARINTTPLDLATAAYAITHVGFARQLMYGLSKSIGGMARGGNFGEFKGLTSVRHLEFNPKDGTFPANTIAYRDRICNYLGFDGEALMIPPAVGRDSLLLNNPEAWVHKQIAQYGGRAE